MPTAYEKTYGAVKFYETDGTPIFDTEDDLDLWTTMDDEPSPEPKWIRVDVPGADGAVDLSRALAGQTTYEMREIRLGFGGKCADHAAALALVHQMRRALHGARVRVETLLTAQIGGYYIADCECDGIAYASGDVEVTVDATADPFIRVGSQTLALPFSAAATDLMTVIDVPVGHDPSVGSWLVQPYGTANGHVCPIGADAVRLWWARGENLFDPSMWPYVASPQRGPYGNKWAWLDGQRIRISALSTTSTGRIQFKASDRGGTWPAWGYSFPFSDFGSNVGWGIATADQKLRAIVTCTITSVGSSPHMRLTATANGTGTDADGFVQGLTASQTITLTTGTYSTLLSLDLPSETWSGSGARSLSAITVEVENAVGSFLVGIKMVTGVPDTSWYDADLGYADVTLDAPIGWYENPSSSDQVQVYPYSTTVSHLVDFDDGTSTATHAAVDGAGTAGGLPTSSAKYVSASLMCDGGQSGNVVLQGVMPTPCTATGSNTTMRSTPSITTNHGAQVTIDGRTAIVGPGTVDLPALVIPGGTFTVDYALFGSNPTDATLSWEGGVL